MSQTCTRTITGIGRLALILVLADRHSLSNVRTLPAIVSSNLLVHIFLSSSLAASLLMQTCVSDVDGGLYDIKILNRASSQQSRSENQPYDLST